MNLVQQSFNRMKTLARESDLPKKLLFDVINQQANKKDFGIIDEKEETLETGEQYQIQSYIQKLQSTIQNLIEAYTQGNTSINDSRDLLSKYNELALYLNTKVKYGSLSIREQNIISVEMDNIIELVQELQYLAERLNLSYSSVYKQLWENLKMRKYVPITFTKETKEKLVGLTKKAYNINKYKKLVGDWFNNVFMINGLIKELDPTEVNEMRVMNANNDGVLLRYPDVTDFTFGSEDLDFYETAMKDFSDLIREFSTTIDVSRKRAIEDQLSRNTENMEQVVNSSNVLVKELTTKLGKIKNAKQIQEIARKLRAEAFRRQRLEEERLEREEAEARAKLAEERRLADEELRRAEEERKLAEEEAVREATAMRKKEEVDKKKAETALKKEKAMRERTIRDYEQNLEAIRSLEEQIRTTQTNLTALKKKTPQTRGDLVTISAYKENISNSKKKIASLQKNNSDKLKRNTWLSGVLSGSTLPIVPEVGVIETKEGDEEDDVVAGFADEDEGLFGEGKTKKKQSTKQKAWSDKVKKEMKKYKITMKEALKKLKK